MTKLLHVAPDHDLPAKILTESIAVLGRKRSGKSNDAAVIVEETLDVPVQTIVLDPKGDWWGLTSSADGKHEGYPVVILGGQHSTIEGGLSPYAGTATAKWVLETGYSVVIDLSQLDKRDIERFCSDFLTELRRAKIAKPGSVLLVVDEADELAPEDQRERVHVLKTMGLLIWCVKRGGAFGIGTLFISQRIASLSKNILSQTEILVVLQTTGSQDLDAITEAVKHHVQGETRKDRAAAVEALIRQIVKLQKGEAVVVSGQMLKGIFHIPFRRRRTFDSGATPDLGQAQKQPKVVAKVALAQLSDAMKRAVEEVKANDPAILRARIRELEAQPKAVPHTEKVVTKVVEKPILKDGQLARTERIVERGHELIEKFRATGTETARAIEAKTVEYVGDLGAMLGPLAAIIAATKSAPSAGAPTEKKPYLGTRVGAPAVRAGEHGTAVRPAGIVTEASRSTALRPRSGNARDDGPARTSVDGLTSAEVRMFRTFAELAAAGVPATRASLGAWQGIRSDTGRFGSYLTTLTDAGYIERMTDGSYRLTPAGEAEVGMIEAPSPDALLGRVTARLTPAERRVLETVLKAGEISRAELAERLGVKGDTGRFGSYITRLKDMGAIEYDRDRSVARIAPFLEGAAA